MNPLDRRQFVRNLGVSAATLPFLVGLPSLGLAKTSPRRQRLVIMFSPNGAFPRPHAGAQWPEQQSTRRRRQPHARDELPAHRHRAVPRQHPRGIRHTSRLVQGHLDRSGDQKLSSGPRCYPHAVWLAGIWRRRLRPGRPVDTHVVRRPQPAGRPDG